MLNDVFPNQLSKEKIYYGKTLPTVNITPKKWLTDYLKNFGNKKIRESIYHSIINEQLIPKFEASLNERRSELMELIAEALDNYSSSKGTPQAEYWANKVMSISNEKDNLEKYRSNLEEGINEADANDYILRLYNVWNYAGRPKISTKPSLLGSIFIPNYYNRATYNPIANTITIPKEDQNVLDYDILKNTISELAHPILLKILKPNKIHTIIDALRSIEELFGKYNRYYDKQHFEYQTHLVIEPLLKNYIYNNKPFPLNNENNTQ